MTPQPSRLPYFPTQRHITGSQFDHVSSQVSHSYRVLSGAVRILTSPSSCRGWCCPTLSTMEPTKPSPGSSSRWSTSPSSRSVVSTVAFSLFVGAGVYQGHKEVLEEGDAAPEEVSDGAESPRLCLENSSIRCNVHHDGGVTNANVGFKESEKKQKIILSKI